MNLLVEGGGGLLGSLIDQNLVNKINMFIAPIFIGGERSINSVGGSGIKLISEARKLSHIKVSQIDQDIMVSGKFI
jgi:diaminohydroxyphosphoribosylaminopyrimidine deaminase/5-amino-6-(5-phosphoribosylamino)uracil reductase